MSESQTQFFQTQLPVRRPATTQHGRHTQSALIRLKQLKEQTKILDRDYKRVLSGVTQTQNSISKLQRNTQKMRVDFLKLYENKKMKLTNRQKLQNSKLESKHHLSMVMRQTKQRKLMDQLQLEATKNEQEQKNMSRQQKNKREKEIIKKQIRAKSFDQQMEAKSQTMRMKEEKQYMAFRNKKIEEIMIMRGKLTYAEKVEREMEMIKQYENILGSLQDLGKESQRPTTSFSRSFFVTTQKLQNIPTKTCGGRDTSHTARTARN